MIMERISWIKLPWAITWKLKDFYKCQRSVMVCFYWNHALVLYSVSVLPGNNYITAALQHPGYQNRPISFLAERQTHWHAMSIYLFVDGCTKWELIHRPLGDVAVDIKVWFSVSLYRMITWAFTMELLSCECQRTPFMRRFGLVWKCNTPMLTHIYVTKWHYYTTMS